MTRLIGADALLVALATSILGALAFFVGVRQRRPDFVRTGQMAVYLTFALVAVSALAMVFALVSHDFSVAYVAQVGSRETPLLYTVISLWGALEGSILFWALVLTGYSAVVTYQHRARPGALVPYAGATLLLISTVLMVGGKPEFLMMEN